MKIEVSNGEIVDKLTIIEIKLKNIVDALKLKNLRNEYEILDDACKQIITKDNPLYIQLLQLNTELWEIEDNIRDLERQNNFGPEFIKAARSVYFTNDKRSEVKREINSLTHSALVEEKSYEKY